MPKELNKGKNVNKLLSQQNLASQGEQVQKTKKDLYTNDAVHQFAINYAREANRQEFIKIKEKYEAGEDIPFWMSVNIRDRQERGLPPPWDPEGDPTTPNDVTVDAIAINWRGGIWASSYDLLKHKLKISKLSLEIMVTRLLHFSWKMWHNYMADTRTIQ